MPEDYQWLRPRLGTTHNSTHNKLDVHVLRRSYAAIRDLQVVDGLRELQTEKAGVGGSTPSLATMFQSLASCSPGHLVTIQFTRRLSPSTARCWLSGTNCWLSRASCSNVSASSVPARPSRRLRPSSAKSRERFAGSPVHELGPTSFQRRPASSLTRSPV